MSQERPKVASAIDEQSTHFPMADRQELLRMQRKVDVAQANVTGAKVAKDEAIQFKTIAEREYKAAQSRLDAANGEIDLGKRRLSQETVHAAMAEKRGADRELDVARRKVLFANQLVEQRQGIIDERQAQLKVAGADLKCLHEHKLVQRGLAPTFNEQSAERDREHASQHLALVRQRAGELAGKTARARMDWEQQRRNVAARGVTTTPIPPPPAPAPITE